MSWCGSSERAAVSIAGKYQLETLVVLLQAQHGVGWRENLQETMDVTTKYRVFLVKGGLGTLGTIQMSSSLAKPT